MPAQKPARAAERWRLSSIRPGTEPMNQITPNRVTGIKTQMMKLKIVLNMSVIAEFHSLKIMIE